MKCKSIVMKCKSILTYLFLSYLITLIISCSKDNAIVNSSNNQKIDVSYKILNFKKSFLENDILNLRNITYKSPDSTAWYIASTLNYQFSNQDSSFQNFKTFSKSYSVPTSSLGISNTDFYNFYQNVRNDSYDFMNDSIVGIQKAPIAWEISVVSTNSNVTVFNVLGLFGNGFSSLYPFPEGTFLKRFSCAENGMPFGAPDGLSLAINTWRTNKDKYGGIYYTNINTTTHSWYFSYAFNGTGEEFMWKYIDYHWYSSHGNTVPPLWTENTIYFYDGWKDSDMSSTQLNKEYNRLKGVTQTAINQDFPNQNRKLINLRIVLVGCAWEGIPNSYYGYVLKSGERHVRIFEPDGPSYPQPLTKEQ